jgi:hypothetical protein
MQTALCIRNKLWDATGGTAVVAAVTSAGRDEDYALISSWSLQGYTVILPTSRVAIFVLLSFVMRPPLWFSGQFLATDAEVPGSIPGATWFSEK